MGIADQVVRDLLLFAFSATLVRINRTFLSTTNRKESRGGAAIFSLYRYKVAKKTVELPLWEQFAQRVARLVEAKRETNQLIGSFYQEEKTATFRHLSATRLSTWLEPGTIDYIYTDPPYGGHIAYLDLSTMWTAWLGLDVSVRDRAEEIIEGGQMRKSADVYNRLMKSAVEQMARVLKPGRWMSIVFAHRDTTYWRGLVTACEAAGLEYVNSVVQPVGVVWSMHKKKNPLRVLSGELVLNFRKSGAKMRPSNVVKSAMSERVVRECCEREIVNGIGATTEAIHHSLVPRLLEADLLERFSREHGDITPVLEENFDFEADSGRWHLRVGVTPSARLTDRQLARYYLRRFLSIRSRKGRPPTEAEVSRHVNSRLKNGRSVNSERMRRLLRDEAYTPDDQHWRLNGDDVQREFLFAH